MTFDQILGNRLVTYANAYEGRLVEPLNSAQELLPGTHLVIPWYGFAHHGIYVGEGRVVHYGARVLDFIWRTVREVDIVRFADGRPVYVVKHVESTLEIADAIARARSRIGESRYRLMSMNCEHFVEWCLHGEHRSFQVESAIDFPRRAAAWWSDRLLGWVVRLVCRTSAKVSGVVRQEAARP